MMLIQSGLEAGEIFQFYLINGVILSDGKQVLLNCSLELENFCGKKATQFMQLKKKQIVKSE